MRQMGEFKFRRQFPVGKYVVDFVCMKKHLASKLMVDNTQNALATTFTAQELFKRRATSFCDFGIAMYCTILKELKRRYGVC